MVWAIAAVVGCIFIAIAVVWAVWSKNHKGWSGGVGCWWSCHDNSILFCWGCWFIVFLKLPQNEEALQPQNTTVPSCGLKFELSVSWVSTTMEGGEKSPSS